MKKLRIFVDFTAPADAMEVLRRGTEGHTLMFPGKPAASVLAKAERDPQFVNAEVAFGQPDTEAIAEAPGLRWLHISSSGYTRYDTAAFRRLVAERGFIVSNSAHVYNEACAAHVLAFMLAQARTLPGALKTRTGNGTAEWHGLRRSCGTLRGETVLILGYGAIGRRLSELLRPFDMKVIGYRRQARGDEGVPVVSGSGLTAALGEADHVINVLPDSGETRGFFDRERFARMKRGAVFYNIGRGVTVDQTALLAALSSGAVGAAWLDVTDPEPLPERHALWTAPNCHITPHIAGGYAGESNALVRHFVENLHRFVRGEVLSDRIM